MRISKKRILIVCQLPPYGSSLARAGIDIALAGSAFDQDISIAFINDGVYQLLSEQNSTSIKQKNHGKIISAFELYDINNIYIDEEALLKRNLNIDDLTINKILMNTNELKKLLNSHDVILNF